MIKHWIHIKNFKNGNTSPSLNDYEYDENDFRVKDFEKVFCEETERSSVVKDRNKGITNITYNHLNLPVRITISSLQFIDYQYNAAGVKISKAVTDGNDFKKVDYIDGFQYAGGVLQFFPHPEGYVNVAARIPEGSTEPLEYFFNYVYNYTDHLGNIRISYTKDPKTGTLEIMDENHYFPFGLKHSIYVPEDKKALELVIEVPGEGEVKLKNVLETEYMFKYQGQERQDELGLNWDSFKWRNYDYAIGRFMSVDPLAEEYHWQSNYAFASNEPLVGKELEGLENDNSKDLRNRTTVVDPGHGGDDPGAKARNGNKNEADITLKISNYTVSRIGERLEGYTDNPPNIILTRDSDINPGGKGQKNSLNARVNIAKDNNADTFVSIHVDSADNQNADRVTVYTKNNPNSESSKLAEQMVSELSEVAQTKQGVQRRTASHHVTREQNPNTAAVLVEVGFITNENQEILLNTEEYLMQLGKAIGDAVVNTLYDDYKKGEINN
ncbi:MAG: N-acetylmuramoyl-L-alanine amidase [Weeksellaceae bacterium]|nr:N-acetylmuramoyl-L-alanine amidase [Acholeplasmataceae bacterium]